MKILVTAIACSPILGSEAYVGWSAVRALSRNHELWVIINDLSKEGAQAAVAKGEVPGNIHFIYHGRSREKFDKTFLSPWHPNRLIARVGSWLQLLGVEQRTIGIGEEASRTSWFRPYPSRDIRHVASRLTTGLPWCAFYLGSN